MTAHNSNPIKPAFPEGRPWLSFLDGIRGFASFWVLASHCLIMCGCRLPIIGDGKLAVDIFIVLSGFIITYQSYRIEKNENSNSLKTWKNFYIRRFFRIAPVYYFLLIFAFYFNNNLGAYREAIEKVFPPPWADGSSGVTNYGGKYTDSSLANILMHLSFLFGLFPQYSSSTPLPDWSIGLEMQFYAVFPFLKLIFRKISYVGTTVLICGSCFLLNKYVIGNYWTTSPPSFLPLKMDLFFVGILLAAANNYRYKIPDLQIGLIIMALIISAQFHSIIIVGIAVIIVLNLFYDRNKDILQLKNLINLIDLGLTNKIAVFMADVSYSVYLLHLLILIPLAAWFANFGWYVSLPAIVRFLVLLVAVVIPTYAIATLLYKYIEKPGIAVGKSLVKS